MLFKKSLQDELLKFIKKDRVRAHMPGHNGGAGLSSGFKRNAFKLDVTEFDETDKKRGQADSGQNLSQGGYFRNDTCRCRTYFY